jgi:hypothetical protein
LHLYGAASGSLPQQPNPDCTLKAMVSRHIGAVQNVVRPRQQRRTVFDTSPGSS